MNIETVIDSLTDDEKDHLVWPMTDTLKMEAVMVLWEVVDDLCRWGWDRKVQESKPYIPAYLLNMTDYRDKVGACQLRHDVMTLMDANHIGWSLYVTNNEHGIAYDWEFTPWFLKKCVKWDPTYGPSLEPDWVERCRAVKFN